MNKKKRIYFHRSNLNTGAITSLSESKHFAIRLWVSLH